MKQNENLLDSYFQISTMELNICNRNYKSVHENKIENFK